MEVENQNTVSKTVFTALLAVPLAGNANSSNVFDVEYFQ